jgi:hypothetical protein
MDNILEVPGQYNSSFIETGRIRPLIDKKLESILADVYLTGMGSPSPFIDSSINGVNPKYSAAILDDFKRKFQQALEASKRNKLTKFDSFNRIDVCLGCTQFIDNLYVTYGAERIQVIEKEYTYHFRLNKNLQPTEVGKLDPNKILILSVPFTNGSMHPQYESILSECLDKNIEIHLDGAWITAARNINIDLSHPAIKSFGVSMSKGYGLSGWNRIGLRWTKEVDVVDTITVMNDFDQTHSFAAMIGNKFLDNIDIDHLWNTHEENYNKIANDFNLIKTDSIHVMLEDGWIRGIAPLLRYLECTN